MTVLVEKTIPMEYNIVCATPELATELVNIRLAAMRESLQAIGRYDPSRARERFLSGFDPVNTMCLYLRDKLVGFYFYQKHGFVLTHQEEWDNYYEYLPKADWL